MKLKFYFHPMLYFDFADFDDLGVICVPDSSIIKIPISSFSVRFDYKHIPLRILHPQDTYVFFKMAEGFAYYFRVSGEGSV